MIWEMVKTIEESRSDDSKELGQAKATMLVNFGPSGKCHSGLVTPEQTLTQMIVSVFEYYEKHNKAMHTDGPELN